MHRGPCRATDRLRVFGTVGRDELIECVPGIFAGLTPPGSPTGRAWLCAGRLGHAVDDSSYVAGNLLHRILAPAKLDLTTKDRFGQPVKPREWLLVPLPIIDEAVNGYAAAASPRCSTTIRKRRAWPTCGAAAGFEFTLTPRHPAGAADFLLQPGGILATTLCNNGSISQFSLSPVGIPPSDGRVRAR